MQSILGGFFAASPVSSDESDWLRALLVRRCLRRTIRADRFGFAKENLMKNLGFDSTNLWSIAMVESSTIPPITRIRALRGLFPCDRNVRLLSKRRLQSSSCRFYGTEVAAVQNIEWDYVLTIKTPYYYSYFQDLISKSKIQLLVFFDRLSPFVISP